MKRDFTLLMAAFVLAVCMMMPLGIMGQTFSRISSISDLADGDEIIFVNQGETYACGTTQNTNNRTPVAITVSNHTYSYSASDNVQVFTVKINSNGKYGFHTGSGYIYSASSTSNNLKTNTTSATTAPSGTSAWSLSVSNSVFSCTNVTNTSYYLAFNGTSYFSQYKSGMSKPYIYKKQVNVSYTVTFNAGNGTCSTASVTEMSGTSITLPTAMPSSACANAGWTFAGWVTQSISETTTAPTLLTGSYTISGNVTLYAVYRGDGGPASTAANMNFSLGSYSNSTITWTIANVVSIKQEQYSGQTPPNSDYVGAPRWYSGNKITITPSVSINSISITTNTEGYATALANSTYTNATASASGTNVTITPTNGTNAIIIVMGGQSRLSALSVNYVSTLYTYATSPSCSEQQQVATPTFSPAGGDYTSAQNVTINCATEDATIYYTTDGTTPTTSSSVYSSAISVANTTTIKAIAVKSGMSNSAVATAEYVISDVNTHTATYTIESATSVSSTGVPSGSSATFNNTYTNNKVQITAGNSMTLTLNGYQGKVITGVVLSMHSNSSKGAGNLSITAGSSSLASISGNFSPDWYSSWTTSFVDVNVPMTDDDYGIQSGEQLVITIAATANSLYCESFTIQYEDDVNPRIIVTAPETLAYDATAGAFGYSISNPVPGTNLQATSDADWISDIQVGDSQVTFNTTVNNTSLERSGTITLTYGTVTKTVTITQAALVPVITISDAPTEAFSYEGGYDSFNFSIDNVVDGAIMTAFSAEYWIKNFDVSEDMVSFEVAPSREDARSGNITLSYMLNGATVTSVMVPISQEANPNEHGTWERPYTVTEARTIISSMGNGVTADNSVYVAGTIYQIDQVEVIQYHNANYHITDGEKTLYVRYGKNLDDTDFYDEDELQVGDRVVICGKLQKHTSSPKYRIAEYNYLVWLERDVEPPIFTPLSCMMGNDESAVVYLESYNDEEVKIHYTMDGTTPDRYSPEYDVENAISLEGETDTITIQAIAYTTDYTKHSAVNSATYIMVPPDTPGLENHPYTVQEALDALDSSSTIPGVYVSGIVSRDPEFSLDNYNNANYYIADNLDDDNELYVYHGRSLNGEPFLSEADLQYGDIVIVYGDLKVYYGVKEFDAKSYIYDLVRPASVSIRPSEVSTNCRSISSSLTVSYNSLSYISSRELQFCDAEGNQVGASTYSWLTANVNTGTGNIDFQIEANDSDASRTAYLKMVLVSGGNTFVSNIVTITQNACSENEFATLPFHYVGNETTVPVGITSDGLGENYDTNPRLNFNSLNDYMTLAFDEVPGVLTFDIQADGFKSSMFYLQTSTNNLDWDDLAIYTTQTMIDGWEEDDPKRDIAIVIQNTAMAQSFAELDESVRYIRWIMSTYSSGSKVRLGNIHLAKPVIYYDIVLTQPQEGGTIVCNKETATEGETVELHASVSEGYVLADWDVLDADNNPIMVEGDGTAAYSFTMPASDVTVEAVIVPDNTDFHYVYSINGVEGQSQTATVGTMLTLAAGSDIVGQPFTFVGWSTNANNVENVMSAGTSYKLTRDVTFYAVYVESVAGSSAVKQYVRVMEDLETNWAGDYLIAYSSDIFADGRIGGTDGMGHVGVSVEPGNNLHDNVVETVWGDLYHVTLEEVSAGSNTYLLKTQDGQYNYNSSNNNGLSVTTNRTTATNYPITVNFVSANDIRLSLGGNAEGAVFRYNSQGYFRFYKDCSQEQVYLYKKTLSTANRYTRVFVDNPTGDIVIAGPSIVPNGSVLNVSSITNSLGTDKLVVEEGAQLVTSSNVNATIKKFINPYQGESDNYYLISSPVDGQNPAEADMMNGEFDLYFFNQSAQGEEWRNYEAGTFNLQTGKGYLYANNYGGYITISGPMVATADGVTIENVSGKNFAGWNLIGNPYPCNVTIGNPYYRLAEGGSALATVSTAETVAIAPMEGVFVYTAAEAEVTFTKAPDVSTTGAGRNTLSLRVSRNRATKDGPIVEDNAIVRFGEGSLLRKLVLNPDNAQLYVAQDGTDYAIVNAEAEGELPVSFRAAENGSYTITANAEGVSFRYLHLIDNKTGADADLLQTPTYSFEATADDYTSRFRLVFSANSVCEDADGDAFAFFNGSQWVVSNEGEATLQVVDVLGRVLSSQVINGDAEVSIYEAQGIYLLRLLSGDSVKVQKIVIR